jgi:hypothetical protein
VRGVCKTGQVVKLTLDAGKHYYSIKTGATLTADFENVIIGKYCRNESGKMLQNLHEK